MSPVYNAAFILPELVTRIEQAIKELNVSYEIILVDDRSPDNSWEILKELSKKTPALKAYRLSRNFGQHATITAGLSKAMGEWIVVMDCDLQDQPKEIIPLYKKAKEGNQIVLARRNQRRDSFLKKLSSKAFSKVYGFLTGTDYDNEIANFGIYHSKVIKAVLEFGDYIKFFPLFIRKVGFKSTSIHVEHAERHSGESTYNFFSLLKLALNTIISFSNRPLKMFIRFGTLISSLSFVGGLFVLYQSFTGEIEVLGYSSIIVSIWFLSGVIITCIGVTGIYVGKVFDQTKERPPFIFDEEA